MGTTVDSCKRHSAFLRQPELCQERPCGCMLSGPGPSSIPMCIAEAACTQSKTPPASPLSSMQHAWASPLTKYCRIGAACVLIFFCTLRAAISPAFTWHERVHNLGSTHDGDGLEELHAVKPATLTASDVGIATSVCMGPSAGRGSPVSASSAESSEHAPLLHLRCVLPSEPNLARPPWCCDSCSGILKFVQRVRGGLQR